MGKGCELMLKLEKGEQSKGTKIERRKNIDRWRKRCSGRKRKHCHGDMRVGAAPRVLKPPAYLALLFPKKKSSADEYLYVRSLKCAFACSCLSVTAKSCMMLVVSYLLLCSAHPHLPFLSLHLLCLSARCFMWP